MEVIVMGLLAMPLILAGAAGAVYGLWKLMTWEPSRSGYSGIKEFWCE